MDKALAFRWRGGYTLRYHGIRTTMPDTVGHHSYNVAQILRTIMPADMPPERRCLLLEAALDHDVAECVTGDMPAPAKRALPDYVIDGKRHTFREVYGEYEARTMEANGMQDVTLLLTAEEAKLLKIADSMDGMRYCVQELTMGNRYAIDTFRAFAGYVAALLEGEPMSVAHELFNDLVEEFYTLGGTIDVQGE